MKTLSILICHLEERKELLDRLMACLEKQMTGEVEIVIETDKGLANGGMKRGLKRNMLLYKARGEYVSMVDDDDLVSDGTEHPAYIPSILTAIESGNVAHYSLNNPEDKIAQLVQYTGERKKPDCVGITGELRFGNDPHLLFYHSMKYSLDWWDDKATAVPGKAQYYRTPNHLNPVRKELAMKARFIDEEDWSEDHSYGKRLHKLIKTEVYIQHPIYYYIK